MDRPLVYLGSQTRPYDVLSGWQLALIAMGQLANDLLGGNGPYLAGFAPTADSPADLSITLAAGSIYQLAEIDATAYGSNNSNTANIMQQGLVAAEKVTLSTAGLSSGQSRWALIEAAFEQVDEIPADDPNAGIENYINTANPSGPPWSGPNNSGAAQNTRRLGTVAVQVIYGSVATTGSEVPPTPTSGWAPLYLIDLSFGQTAITQGQILTAGPSVGTGVPSNYPAAPFINGLSQFSQSGRTRLTANPTTFYVNASTGNDTNPGTSGAPWATLQRAANYIWEEVDLASCAVIVQCSGAFTAGLTVQAPPVGAGPTLGGVTFQFQSGSSITVSSGNAILIEGTILVITGTPTISAPSGNGIAVSLGGILLLAGSPIFGQCSTSSPNGHIQCTNGGQCLISGNYSITEGAFAHLAAIGMGAYIAFIGSVTVTLSGSPAFTDFIYGSGLAEIYTAFVSWANSGTGTKYNISPAAGLNTGNGGSTIPVPTSGTVTSPGWVQ